MYLRLRLYHARYKGGRGCCPWQICLRMDLGKFLTGTTLTFHSPICPDSVGAAAGSRDGYG